VTTVAFLVAHEGIEQVELTEPWKDVQDAGATPILVSTTSDEVQGFDHLDKADTFEVDHEVSDVSVDDFDLLLLPGGVANPDALRMDEGAVALVKATLAAGKPVAAICHAPWMLVEADGVRGRKVTSWPSLRTDLTNAGATWVDEQVVVDEQGAGPLITSRNPDDLEAFGKAVVSHLS
jgi:protease I